jgi:CRP-like cAMP-binding protein
MNLETTSTFTDNKVLAALSPEDFALLEPHLEPVSLDVRQMLERANKPIKHSYFLNHGLASVIAIGKNGHRLEVGLIGREGMTGLAVVTGNDRSPNETFIQVQGSGSRINAEELRGAIRESRSLHKELLKFVQDFMILTAHTALSNATATVTERLARWLLMAQDRLGGDEVPLTHEFLSLMLGIRREGVTVTLNALKRKGYIRLMRGCIQIADRRGLIAAANGSYGIPEAAAKRTGLNR